MKKTMNDGLMMLHLGSPAAHVRIRGSDAYPELYGHMELFAARGGTVLTARLRGLPFDDAPCAPNICAMHIHAGGACTGKAGDPFSDALGHYNPGGCPHPAHAGDLPPLFSNNGFAWQSFYTQRFLPGDVIGRTIIIHEKADDFTSQPAGSGGARIGCGVIVKD